MTQPAKRPSTATRRTGGSQPTLNGHGPDEQDLRGDQELVGDRDRDDRSPRETQGEQWHGDRGELGEPGGVQRSVEQVTDRVRAATSNPGDAFALTPDMSKVVTAWFDVAGDMMKLQQQFFASMLGAGNTNDRTTTKV
jgi:hypothetical protein